MLFPNHVPQHGSRSLLGRFLEPFASALWILFLLWTVFIAVTWLAGIGEVEIGESDGNSGLVAALRWILSICDQFWVMLAAANVYLSLADADGLQTARRRASITMVAVWIVAALSAWMHFPLGSVRYSDRLGVHLGPVSVGAPLLWFALVHGARETALRLAPRARHETIATITAVLILVSDLDLEPIAWKFRAWWIWYPSQLEAPSSFPISCVVTWVVVSGLLAFSFRGREANRRSQSPSWQPVVTFGLLNAVFLAARVRHS